MIGKSDAGSSQSAATTSEEFWERHYAAASAVSTGMPSAALVRFAGPLAPGRALDLGCSRGDDAVWLAGKGWNVVAVDVSTTVLGYAADNAKRAGVADRIDFQRHDLAVTFPDGRFDLVSALFLESPVDFARTNALKRAAAAVDRDGILLVVDHGSHAPWSWSDPDTPYPSADEALAKLDLPATWERLFVGKLAREAKGPGGQTATVEDMVLALKRLDG